MSSMSNPWISHRGLDERYTENTEAAFDAALDAGFEHLETDLRSTVDGGLVLHHDARLSRTAAKPGRIETLSFNEFRQIRYHCGQPGLTLERFMARFDRARWVLDIKPEHALRTLRSLSHWARETGKLDWIVRNARFLMWRPQDEVALKMLMPGAQTLAGAKECRRAGASILLGLPLLGRIREARTYSLPPRFMGRNLYDPRITGHYHGRKAHLLAYLPEQVRDMENALMAGADEILINGRPPAL